LQQSGVPAFSWVDVHHQTVSPQLLGSDLRGNPRDSRWHVDMFDAYGRSRWAVMDTSRSTSAMRAQITFDSDLPMPFGVFPPLLRTQEIEDMGETGPGRLRPRRLYQGDHFIGTGLRAVATANTFVSENLHHPVSVARNGVAWRAILETWGPFTVTTSNGHMDLGQARTRGAIEARLTLVGRRAGFDTVITSDTLGLIDEEDIAT
jgi:hypothetical protein